VTVAKDYTGTLAMAIHRLRPVFAVTIG
jgi:hypothetical protein